MRTPQGRRQTLLIINPEGRKRLLGLVTKVGEGLGVASLRLEAESCQLGKL
jgi:hypothetical protein